MATLEDKILGEKTHCYCSSSSSEHEDDSEDESNEKKVETVVSKSRTEPYKWEGISTNTGPKGVIKDWQRFKQLEIEKRDDQERERLDLMKKLSLTCDNKQEEDPEIAELLVDDGFLLEYQKQRMEEMLSKKGLPKFGQLFDLKNNNDFLDAIDKEHRGVTIIIHIYENNLASCKCMNECLNTLARSYPHVKFCKFISSSAGMSHRFKMDGVPALLVYKGGQVIGNFVRVTNELGEEFYEGDVENFLIEHGMIVDRSCVPSIVQS